MDPKLSDFYQRDDAGQVITNEEGRPLLAARPQGLRSAPDLDRVLADIKPAAVLERFAAEALQGMQWAWAEAYQAWLDTEPAEPVRARDPDGQYIPDDPDTPQDDAWLDGYTPEMHQQALGDWQGAEPQRPDPDQTPQQLIDSRPGAERWRKWHGVEFDGVMCSATKEDMWGLNSVEAWVRAGNATRFDFDNGSQLILTPENLDAFQAVWVPFRAGFFQ